MFVLHTSNKAENLLEHLVKVLESPLSSPFTVEEFLVQSQGMERWLCQQLAEKLAVWSNYEFHFPGKFYNRLVDDVLESVDCRESISREQMVWRLESLLRELPEDGSVELLRNYLGHSNIAQKRYQLAKELAYVFDQYQFLRYDWIEGWQRRGCGGTNQAERWQCQLWQALNVEGKGQRWLRAIDQLQAMSGEQAREYLPERLSVFGLSTLSPLYLLLLKAIAKHIPVHFYLLSPASGYWGDIKRRRTAALPRQQELFTLDENQGNPFLSALAQQGRDFQELLVQDDFFDLDYTSFEKSDAASLLAHVQNDLLQNQVNAYPAGADDSIHLHACHSRLREMEVIRDEILKVLDDSHELGLRDIVVMAPDIHQYAPWISAVFADIPHSIADASERQRNRLLEPFLQFLEISQSRWEWADVLALLEQPAICSSYDLDASDREIIRVWVTQTHTRWGESATHRAEYDLPAFAESSWKTGLERLMMGYMLNREVPEEGVYPYLDIEGSAAQALGKLHDFMRLLRQCRRDFAKQLRLADWCQKLFRLQDSLFPADQEWQDDFRKLASLMEQLEAHSQQHPHKISLEVVISWLRDASASVQSAAGFMRGQLTFCSLLPMRAIPFPVIVLAGMNEGEIPRQDHPADFDLMMKKGSPRAGDRSLRADDRYQFLEVLLSARKQLIISYVGLSNRNNELHQPSVVISELQDILQQGYGISPDQWLTRHRLFGYSPHYYQQDGGRRSFSQRRLAMARALQQPEAIEPDWSQAIEVEEQGERLLDIGTLRQFLKHPQRFFCHEHLKVVIPSIAQQIPGTENFSVDPLQNYQFSVDWLEEAIKNHGRSPDQYEKSVLVDGWPAGQSGQMQYADVTGQLEHFYQHLEVETLGRQQDDMSIEAQLGEWWLTGSIPGRYQNGGLHYRPAKLKGEDVLSGWLNHLFSCKAGAKTPTRLVYRNDRNMPESMRFRAVDEPLAEDYLELVLALFENAGQQASLLCLPAWLKWFRQHGNEKRKSCLQAAEEGFVAALERDPYYQLLYGSTGWFEENAAAIDGLYEQLALPILEYIEP